MSFKKVLQNIFSIKNEDERKVLRFFFLKISFKRRVRKPKTTKNTFFLWEPSAISHGEVVPGFVKYLLELGYDVSVLMTPDRIDEGLFSKFKHKNLFLNTLTQNQIRRYFEKYGLKEAKGVIITTARNASKEYSTYEDKLKLFKKTDAVFLVDHDVKAPVDGGFWSSDIITLAPVDYKNASSVVVNPCYFGEVKPHRKNKTVNFLIIGSLENQRRNLNLLFDKLKTLNQNFKITVVGLGDYSIIPSDLRKYFETKGRLDFSSMYDCIENSDFILALLDSKNEKHYRYITTGTSGSYQLSCGFCKPLIIDEAFCKNRFLDDNNSIVYKNNDLFEGLKRALEMSEDEYQRVCVNLAKTADEIRESSKENLRELIKNKGRI